MTFDPNWFLLGFVIGVPIAIAVLGYLGNKVDRK